MYIKGKSDRRESKAVVRGSSSHRHVKGRIFDCKQIHFKSIQCFIDAHDIFRLPPLLVFHVLKPLKVYNMASGCSGATDFSVKLHVFLQSTNIVILITHDRMIKILF